MHHLARLARFGDESDLGSRFLAHQQVVHGGQRQQAGDGRVVLVHAAIGKNQQRVAGLHRQRSSLAQLFERALQSSFAVAGAEQRGQRGGQQISGRNPAQFFQIAIGQQRMRQLQHVAVLGALPRMLRSLPM